MVYKARISGFEKVEKRKRSRVIRDPQNLASMCTECKSSKSLASPKSLPKHSGKDSGCSDTTIRSCPKPEVLQRPGGPGGPDGGGGGDASELDAGAATWPFI